MKNNIKKKIKENKGFTLVEALIAIIILAIVSVLMVQGVSMARRAYSSNKMKTEAAAIANQEIEKIRTMPYNDVGIPGGDPSGALVDYTTSSGYLVEYSVIWSEESTVEIKRTKQVKVSASKDLMKNKIEVVTELTPLGEILIAGNTTTTLGQHPAPNSLIVISDIVNRNNKRTVILSWQKPSSSTYEINHYNIYRNNEIIGTITSNNTSVQYTDSEFGNKDYNQYIYFITAVYSDSIESLISNGVTANPIIE